MLGTNVDAWYRADPIGRLWVWMNVFAPFFYLILIGLNLWRLYGGRGLRVSTALGLGLWTNGMLYNLSFFIESNHYSDRVCMFTSTYMGACGLSRFRKGIGKIACGAIGIAGITLALATWAFKLRFTLEAFAFIPCLMLAATITFRS